MSVSNLKYHLLAFFVLLCVGVSDAMAQDVSKAQKRRENLADSLTLSQIESELDSLQLEILAQARDSIARLDSLSKKVAVPNGQLTADSVYTELPKAKFVPDPKKSLWYAIAFPGGGQIYNRKYWKLPIVYGGFLGCYYALSWNNNMYRDYSQAYIDIMDSDPNSQSYMNFIPRTYNVEANMERLKEIFKRKKDFYRRYRDLSFFCMLAVYGLSIIDAYVDAELSSFDISSDLTLKVKPSVIRDENNFMAHGLLNGNSYGLQCSFDF